MHSYLLLNLFRFRNIEDQKLYRESQPVNSSQIPEIIEPQTKNESRILHTDHPPFNDSGTSDVEDTCEPVQKVVFIKTHKTASSTTTTLLERYGYLRNLNFAMSKTGHIISEKLLFKASMIFRVPGLQPNNYDMLVNHARLNRTEMDLVVPRAKYISILRKPDTQLESTFSYFRIAKKLKLIGTNSFKVFMLNPEKYYGMKPIGYFFLRNGQLYDLGFHKDHKNLTQIQNKIQELSEEIDLMMITEYYDESLLLLKKLLCWDFDDILYVPQGVRSGYNRGIITPDISHRIQEWNVGDVMLYDHFNRTFWQKVRDYGGNFETDLAHFRELKQNLLDLCFKPTMGTRRENGRGSFEDFLMKSNSPNASYCKTFKLDDLHFTGLIRKGMVQRAFKGAPWRRGKKTKWNFTEFWKDRVFNHQ